MGDKLNSETNKIITEMGANHSVSEIHQAIHNRDVCTNELSVIKCLREACIIPHSNESIATQRGISIPAIKTQPTTNIKERIRGRHTIRKTEKPIQNREKRYKYITERDGHVCQICGAKQVKWDAKNEDKVPFGTRLHVHHISPYKHRKTTIKKDKKDHRPSNMITLCKKCHDSIHMYNRAVKRLKKASIKGQYMVN